MTESSGKCSCLTKCSNIFVHALETVFLKLGLLIGKHPWITILLSLIVVGCFLPGIPLFFFSENRQERLWVASNAEALKDREWVDQYFSSGVRFNGMIIESDNVLTSTVLKAMLEIDKKVKAIEEVGRYNWTSKCKKLGSECWSNSLLELWSFDESVINSLTDAQIVEKVNTVTVSPVYLNEYNIENVLGGIERQNGRIVSARATIMNYFLTYEFEVIDGTEVDAIGNDWELKYLEIAENGQEGIDNVFYSAFRSFADEGGGAITGDLVYLIAGYVLIIFFVCIVLGRFNQIEQRIYVCLGGIACIGLAIGFSFGLCSYAGFFYSPLHSILPFLVLGIGVDDMFVIVSSWENIKEKDKNRPVHEKIGLTLKDAGVSITITSLTDILAFGIGATTIIPALKSFCVYCCFGILATFFLQATFFVACLAINEKRVISLRNACCCCYKHPDDWEPNECSQRQFAQMFFDNYYATALLKLPVKIVIVVIALILLGVNIWGTVEMEQEFDASWFIPSDSYASAYIKANNKYFPSDGIRTSVYMGQINYFNDFDKLMSMYHEIDTDEYTKPGSSDAWFYGYQLWLNSTTDSTVIAKLNPANFPILEEDFYDLLQRYLLEGGSRFLGDFVFNGTNIIVASRWAFDYMPLNGASVEIRAMDRTRDIVRSYEYPFDQLFAYSVDYLEFESNRVIQEELYRNLGLAFLCVFVMCLILIANLWACLLVALCVVLTLVDVVGCLHFWGLTIDVVTSVNLIVAIGLAVDYSAHMAHTFMVEQGTKKERTSQMISHMAPAVFYGGFSTFLAFVLLAGSNSYVFSTFFKVFFLVVLFGLFHGILFLPVLLSWVGPSAYALPENALDQDSPAEKTEVRNGKVSPHQEDIVMVENSTEKPTIDGFVNGGVENEDAEPPDVSTVNSHSVYM